MPIRIVEQFVAAMPRLQAQESLIRATEGAVGSGNLKKGEASRIMRGWESQAFDTRNSRRAHRAETAEEHAMLLAGVGIQFDG